jgi:hypothetical protein
LSPTSIPFCKPVKVGLENILVKIFTCLLVEGKKIRTIHPRA